MEIGARIRSAREGLGLSQEELAKRVGYTSRSSVAKVEAGEVDLPQSKILAFAKALDISPVELMGLPSVSSTLGSLANASKEAVDIFNSAMGAGPSMAGSVASDAFRAHENYDLEADLQVALFGGDGEVTEEMWDEVKNFAQFVKARENGRKESK